MPRWPEEPLAQLSWASSPWHRWRSRTHLRPGMWSPVSSSTFTSIARQRGACLPDERFLNGEGQGTTRPWSQMHGRLRRRCRAEEDRCPVFASRAASADRYDSTCYSVTWCETGHSCCRAAHWRTACKSCGVTAHCRESGKEPSFEGQARHSLPLPLLADMPRVEYFSVCRARGVRSGRLAPARAPARSARGVTCDT